MAKGIPVNPVIKNQIITSVKNGEMSVYKAAEKFNIPRGTVKNWFANGKNVAGTEKSYITEINALRKELDNAYRVIGKLAANSDRPKG